MGLVIVTGGSRGIGAAVCRRLAADGHAVAVNYATDAAAAEATAAAIEAAGGEARAVRADVADPAAVERMFAEAVEALGPLAGLVNCAGSIGRFAPVAEQDPADVTRLFAVNAIGTMLCCREAARRLSTRRGGKGGAIVNISSIAARLGGLPGIAPYAATKGAVESFTKAFANEMGPEGVRVNAVAPGMIDTDMTDGFLSQPGARERIVAMTPLGRIGAPEDVAEAVAWLMSPAAAFVTGSVLTLSGGR